MIKSSKQYEVTRRRLGEFDSAIAEFELAKPPPSISASAHQAAYDALISLREELTKHLAEYDRVKAQGVQAIHFSRLADLPRVLIQTRIARKMTQTALAKTLEVAPQQVQRWEADDYETTGLAYVLEIGEILDVDEVIARTSELVPQIFPISTALSPTRYTTEPHYEPSHALPVGGHASRTGAGDLRLNRVPLMMANVSVAGPSMGGRLRLFDPGQNTANRIPNSIGESSRAGEFRGVQRKIAPIQGQSQFAEAC